MISMSAKTRAKLVLVLVIKHKEVAGDYVVVIGDHIVWVRLVTSLNYFTECHHLDVAVCT